MKHEQTIIVFDFETGGLDIPTLEPLQVACLAIHPQTLRVIEGSEFNSLMRPLDFNNLNPQALAKNKITKEQLKTAPSQESVWRRFAEHVGRFKQGGGVFGRPISAGKNIRNFDLPIVQRLCATYGMVDKDGQQSLFHRLRVVDLDDILYQLFGHTDELPKHGMDQVREYFGISTKGAHDAMVDTRQTAELLIRLAVWQRANVARTKFKGSFAGE